LSYDSEVSESEGIRYEAYVDQNDWDKFEQVKHKGDGMLQVEGIANTKCSDTPTNKLLEWHVRFSHMPFSRLQALEQTGVLSTCLSKCKIQVCASCMYGKLPRKPWQ
jgi:GAG-pre-integrase domain